MSIVKSTVLEVQKNENVKLSISYMSIFSSNLVAYVRDNFLVSFLHVYRGKHQVKDGALGDVIRGFINSEDDSIGFIYDCLEVYPVCFLDLQLFRELFYEVRDNVLNRINN